MALLDIFLLNLESASISNVREGKDENSVLKKHERLR